MYIGRPMTVCEATVARTLGFKSICVEGKFYATNHVFSFNKHMEIFTPSDRLIELHNIDKDEHIIILNPNNEDSFILEYKSLKDMIADGWKCREIEKAVERGNCRIVRVS